MQAAKGTRFPTDVLPVCIRWYAAYPLSYRRLDEMMQERGVFVDHSSINRWAIRFLPLLEKVLRRHKRPMGGRWRMDGTYLKVKDVWKYFYRAMDKQDKYVRREGLATRPRRNTFISGQRDTTRPEDASGMRL